MTNLISPKTFNINLNWMGILVTILFGAETILLSAETILLSAGTIMIAFAE